MADSKQKEYRWHRDPGHSWLEVPKQDLKDSGIARLISGYSYMSYGSVFLEEDHDAPIFLDRMAVLGYTLIKNETWTNTPSKIRSLRPYGGEQSIG